ncbi:MAG: transglutaminase family protein [Pseudomonadota bacterium]
MLLSVRHTTRQEYAPAAATAAFRLKLCPPNTSAQKLIDWQVRVNGNAVSPLLTDALGNRVALWHAHVETALIEIVAEGQIQTTDVSGVLAGISEAARPQMCLRQTPLTMPDEKLQSLAQEVDGDNPLAKLHALSEAIHAAIDYRPGATTPATSAAEAAAIGAGVCQDHAHIFIACCRALEIPARYVAGYLADFDGELRVGEQTHAWAEAHVPGLGWVGFDVTNQLCPTDAYIRLAAGLDADDAALVRGVVGGQADQKLSVDVLIEQSQSQSQA